MRDCNKDIKAISLTGKYEAMLIAGPHVTSIIYLQGLTDA